MIGDIDYKSLAELTSGLTGADIANIVNQSKTTAIQRNHDKIELDDIKFSVDEVMIGRKKNQKERCQKMN